MVAGVFVVDDSPQGAPPIKAHESHQTHGGELEPDGGQLVEVTRGGATVPSLQPIEA